MLTALSEESDRVRGPAVMPPVRSGRLEVEQVPTVPVQLQTVWGVGYRWEAGVP